jgi:hypothetical protein
MGSLRTQQFFAQFFILALCCVICIVGACRSERTGPASSLKERVEAFWDARIAGDDLKAYNYEAYAKNGKMSATDYVRARSPTLKYKSYEIKNVEEQGDRATITMDLYYQLIVPTRADLALSMVRKEEWVRLDDGQWYREVKNTAAFPGPRTTNSPP